MITLKQISHKYEKAEHWKDILTIARVFFAQTRITLPTDIARQISIKAAIEVFEKFRQENS
jgi:hypothetical protein